MLQFLSDSASPIGAVVKAIWFALIFGAWMTYWWWGFWPGANDLPPRDRVAVVRAVRRGEDIGEPRLAPAVVDFADVVRRLHGRDHRYRWVLWLFPGGALYLALYDSLAGSTRSAVLWWALVGCLAVFIAWVPRRSARMLARAERAESLARRTLN